MDRLGNIEAFVTAAELGSLTLAARRLGVTPSALSRRVARLEDELGVRLLHRTTVEWLTILFPPPKYELPNDIFFEATGVLQLLPAVLTARAAIRFQAALRGAA